MRDSEIKHLLSLHDRAHQQKTGGTSRPVSSGKLKWSSKKIMEFSMAKKKRGGK